jgi:predicted transcriptional regulator
MTIVRREHRAHFTILPNAIFVDERLSIEAKGVLAYLLSRPNKWAVRLEQVGRILNVGRRKLQRVFRELISAGYVTREQRRIAGAQRFGQVDYVVRDVPVTVTKPVVKSAERRKHLQRLTNLNCGRGAKMGLLIKN